jgi:hypothetical protein
VGQQPKYADIQDRGEEVGKFGHRIIHHYRSAVSIHLAFTDFFT